MKLRYTQIFIAVAVFLAMFVYYLANAKMIEEAAPVTPAATGTSPEATQAAAPTKAKELLIWWDDKLKIAVQEQKWNVAADYAYRKAGYYRSVGREEEAQTWYRESERYWDKDPVKDKRFYDEKTPDPQKVKLAMYVSVPAPLKSQLAKYEPQSGAYLGMFGVSSYNTIESTFGRYHPIALTYAGWRRNEQDSRNYFPMRTVDSVKAAGGGAIQIGWEPSYGLDSVKDDDYVRDFARQSKAAGIPIFLRYASEMNGEWVPWYDKPEKYVEKFRLVSAIMKEEAPNVVMVWSPNFWPNDNIDAYYPGDDYVDWVGFSLYTSPFVGAEEDFSKNLIDYFIPLYEKYSYKPIMISEGGVSHYYLKTNTDYAKWAEGQIGNMYGFLPRMFPQVKAVTYFNVSRQRAVSVKMDHVYDIKDNMLMYNQYQRLVKSDYFLSTVEKGIKTTDNVQYVPLASAAALKGKHRVFTYVQMPLGIQPFALAVYQGDRRLAISYESPWEVELDFSALDPDLPLTVVAYNGKLEIMARQSFKRS